MKNKIKLLIIIITFSLFSLATSSHSGVNENIKTDENGGLYIEVSNYGYDDSDDELPIKFGCKGEYYLIADNTNVILTDRTGFKKRHI